MRDYGYWQQMNQGNALQGLSPIGQALQNVAMQKLMANRAAGNQPIAPPMPPSGLRASVPLIPTTQPGMAAGLAQMGDSLSPALAGRANILQAILSKFGVIKQNPGIMGQ